MQNLKPSLQFICIVCLTGAENRDLTKFFLTYHLTLWQWLDWTPGRYTYRKTRTDRTCHSPDQIHPDAWSASVRSTNEKPSQPMLQSSSWSYFIDWLNAILPGAVKLGWACLGLRRQFWFQGLVFCWCTITGGEQPSWKQKSCTGHIS